MERHNSGLISSIPFSSIPIPENITGARPTSAILDVVQKEVKSGEDGLRGGLRALGRRIGILQAVH